MDTLTKEQHDAAVQAAVEAANAAAEQRIADAVAEAVGPLQTELEDLRRVAGDSELEAAVATATAGLRDELTVKQTEIETAQAQLAAVTAERDTLLNDKAAFEDAVVTATRKDERVAAVKELEVFPETFIADQADQWAALDDDGWAAKLVELGSLKDIVVPPSDGIPSRRSALTAASTAGDPPAGSAASRLIRQQAGLLTTAPTGN